MKVIYLTYDGLLDPLGQSQIMPYLRALAEAGYLLTVISYEKEERSTDQVKRLDYKLAQMGISWHPLVFRSGKLGAIARLYRGVCIVRKLCGEVDPRFFHLRGLIPAVIYKLACTRKPYLYDFRGFALGEWVDMKKVTSGRPLHFFLDLIDKNAVKGASGFVVLEKSAERLLRKEYAVPNVPYKIIRTCTDMSRYRQYEIGTRCQVGPIHFVFLGGARYPYRADLSLTLIMGLLDRGLNCRIDFINERDHEEINNAISRLKIDRRSVIVQMVDQSSIPEVLSSYDCGIIMIETSEWRRVCSPTKLGEYFAAGLPVVALSGIDIIDELSQRTRCVMSIDKKDFEFGVSQEKANQICEFTRRIGLGLDCQLLAASEFNMRNAAASYVMLYDEIGVLVNQ